MESYFLAGKVFWFHLLPKIPHVFSSWFEFSLGMYCYRRPMVVTFYDSKSPFSYMLPSELYIKIITMKVKKQTAFLSTLCNP